MNRAFTILEVILALAIVALVMAALGPALIGSLRAERQARAILGPLMDEPMAITQLREDLLAAPRPVGSVAVPLLLTSTQVAGRRGDSLQVFISSPMPLHPNLALRAPEVGQAVVTWSAKAADGGRGLAWTRSRKADLLAAGITADPVAEIMLDHLAILSVEAYADGGFLSSYDSSTRNDVLPAALRISWAQLRDDGSSGPLRVVVIDLPQVALDPTQSGGGA